MGMANSGHEHGMAFFIKHNRALGRPTITMQNLQQQHHSCDPGGSTWLDRLYELLARHSEHGSAPDVESMSMIELLGLYLGLRRKAEREAAR
jgi:hypothetical protein